MNNMRQIARDTVRFALQTIYKENSVYPVPFGPWRGMKMRYFSTLQFHMILGLYDTSITDKLSKVLRATGRTAGDSVYCDLGANVGMYSLWFSRMNPTGKIFSFEPLPQTMVRLKDHLEINHIKNVVPLQMACSNEVGKIAFFVGDGAHEVSSLLSDWADNGGKAEKIEVATTTLDAFFSDGKNGEAPDFIKMDIEGGGVYALKGCRQIIEKKHPLWMVESHTPEEDRAISDMVTQFDYQAYRLNDSKWVKDLKDIHPNPNGIWGTLILVPTDEMDLVKKILP